MDTKACTACGATSPLTNFHRCKKTKDSRVAICKPCARARSLAYWATEQGQAKLAERKGSRHVKEIRRKWQAKPENKAKAKAYQSTPERRKAAVETQKRWRIRNRMKKHAHDAVKYRVNVTLEIPRPETLCCADCGAQASEYHHPDYSRALDVVALCKACHEIRHHDYPLLP